MKTVDFSKLTRKAIRSLQPYQAKEVPCKAKLDANESPFSMVNPADILGEAALRSLNRYPDPDARELKKAIAQNFKVGTENVLLGNGSDELLYYLIVTFGGPVVYPVPTFSMYGIISKALGERHRGVVLDKDFDLDSEKMGAVIKRDAPRLVFLSSPNNPTGNCFSPKRIKGIIEASPGIVVVDEAYLPFAERESFLSMMSRYKNLAVLKTLSKIGFAALRVGFLIAHKDLVKEVNKVRLPYNVNALSQAIAVKAFRNSRVVQRAIRTVVSERGRVFRELAAIEGVVPYPSEANFILFKVAHANEVFKGLAKGGVLVRNMDGVLKDTLRVTIGTPEENDLFVTSLRTATVSTKGF